MTRFADKSFSSRPATDQYRKGWDEVFKRAKRAKMILPAAAPPGVSQETWDEQFRQHFFAKPKKRKRGKR